MENLLVTATDRHIEFLYGDFGISGGQQELDIDS